MPAPHAPPRRGPAPASWFRGRGVRACGTPPFPACTSPRRSETRRRSRPPRGRRARGRRRRRRSPRTRERTPRSARRPRSAPPPAAHAADRRGDGRWTPRRSSPEASPPSSTATRLPRNRPFTVALAAPPPPLRILGSPIADQPHLGLELDAISPAYGAHREIDQSFHVRGARVAEIDDEVRV